MRTINRKFTLTQQGWIPKETYPSDYSYANGKLNEPPKIMRTRAKCIDKYGSAKKVTVTIAVQS